MKGLVERLASSVAEGKPVDWVREKSRRPDHLDEIEQLALIERIRDAHRTVLADATGPNDETKTAEVAETKALFSWGTLDVLEFIGQGSGGDVYRAHDRTLNVEVALKLLRTDTDQSPAVIESFLEEGRRLARVHHPNVLVVHGAGFHEGRAGIWTEFVRGQSLEGILAAHGPLGATEAAIIGLDMCRAIAAVHAAGIVHRDIKASNIMRQERGRIVLMDFGAGADLRSGVEPGIEGVHGTPLYLPPEQLRGESTGAGADLYALGVLLYHLVSGQYPIDASSYGELIEKQRRSERVPLRDRRPDLPLPFIHAVERATDPDPQRRYPSAGEMERGLAETIRAFGRDAENRRRFQGFLVGAIAAAVIVASTLLLRDQVLTLWRGWTRGDHPAPTSVVEPALLHPVLNASIELRRRDQGGETRLSPDDRIAIGQQLSMLLKANDSLHVYVIDHDSKGEFFILYPLNGVEPRNPLSGSYTHRLPGDMRGQMIYWTVTSAGGREEIIVIGSRRPLPDFEAQVAKLPAALPGHVRFGRLNPMGLRNLRGMESGTVAPPPPGEAQRRVLDYVAALAAQGKQDSSVFVWQQRLRNP